jgi:hypothetical protein
MRACHARPLYTLWVGHPPNGLTAVWAVARPQGGRLAAVFFPLGYPFLYGPAHLHGVERGLPFVAAADEDPGVSDSAQSRLLGPHRRHFVPFLGVGVESLKG